MPLPNPLVFATNNAHKVMEVKHLFDGWPGIISLAEAGITIDIPEPYYSLEANARHKCVTIFERTGRACFAEDTGLEVEALGGRPGVRTARFAGENATADQNIDEMLRQMARITQRQARFRTVVCAQLGPSDVHFFEGICSGQILGLRLGTMGFGYDPIFMPDGSGYSFGQMTLGEKKAYSHRAKAFENLKNFFTQQV
jgi:XTP/dITP diphosphohydrolase